MDIAGKSMKAILAGVIINLLLAMVKGVAGVLGNSHALVADAVESVSDVFTSLVVFFAIQFARKGPDKEHPYGHGKAEPIAGAIVSVVLVIAALSIIITSVQNILMPGKAPAPFTLLVLVLVIVVKEVLFRLVSRVGGEADSTALKADAWHHRSDAITSAAVFIGILVSIVGGKGFESADDWAAMVAALIILYNAWRTLKPALGEIMDESAPEEFIDQVRHIAAEVPGVMGTDKCFVRKMGFHYYVDMHVVVSGDLSVKKGHDIAHQVKDRIIRKKPRITNVFVHIEPYDPNYEGQEFRNPI